MNPAPDPMKRAVALAYAEVVSRNTDRPWVVVPPDDDRPKHDDQAGDDDGGVK